MKKIISALAMSLLAFTVNADPPTSSGIVTRGEYQWAWWYVDSDAGLGLVVGTDVVTWCSGSEIYGFISYSDKNIQDGLRLSTLEKSDDLIASVWPFTELDCDRFLTELPLATGEVRRRVHDNDLFGNRYCDVKNNMNAWGISVQGTLYSPFGEKRQLSANFWGLYDCDTLTFPVSKTKIVLTD